jgi:hypothetical protein
MIKLSIFDFRSVETSRHFFLNPRISVFPRADFWGFCNMKILNNNNKYLSTALIEKCFEAERVNYVNKMATGNGFTFGFAQLKPVKGKINVLICPNIAVAKDKKADYLKHEFGFEGAKIGFLFQGSKLEKSINYYDILVCVADSFVLNYYDLKLTLNTDKLLIDESHSVEQQSTFRYSLIKMQRIIEDYFQNTSVVYVTATPNLYSKVDIQIKNNIQQTDLNISRNTNNTIDRIIDSINDGIKTLIFTNNASVVETILNRTKRDDFNFVGGSRMLATIYKKKQVRIDENSNIMIITSGGFEGFSDYSFNSNVFIFVNYHSKNESFLASNIYQALGRTRNGYNYAELLILTSGNDFPIYDAEEVVNYIINAPIEMNFKQKRKHRFNYKGREKENRHYLPFIEFYNEEEVILCRPFIHKLNLNKEVIEASDNFISTYQPFFKDRNVNLIQLKESIFNRRIQTRTSRENKNQNLIFNLSNDESIFDECFFQRKPTNQNQFLNDIEDFLIVSNGTFNSVPNKYLKAFELLSNESFYNDLEKLFIRRQQEKSEGTIKQNKKEFEETYFPYCLEIVRSILTEYVSPYYNGHRDYNIFTAVNNYILEYIAEKLELTFYELDIRNAFPRLVHRLNGFELLSNFYEHSYLERSVVKRKINTLLNDLSIDVNRYVYNRKKRGYGATKQQIQDYKKNKRRNDREQLKEFGFDEQIIEWLITNYSDNTNRGALFNLLSYHEREIIKKAKKTIDNDNPNTEFFAVRKHDAIIYFFNDIMTFESGKYIEYLDAKNWF